jgi:tRNA uridine 5-carboxymethylaminomethyl modification enzyme
MSDYDIIVIGAGHAGIEAATAASRMGCSVLMLTLNEDTIGAMSCNPAIGGVGKGQLVKEIDALGGQMGKAADACGIQFRILNASKGAAVQSSRAQIDMYQYNRYMTDLARGLNNLEIKESQVRRLIVEGAQVKGVVTDNEEIGAKVVVIATGTFLDGLIHIGLKHESGGRIGEPASLGLGDNLRGLGFKILRFKTGTCPRLDRNSINFSKTKAQYGDDPPKPFSFSTREFKPRQIPCYITHTNLKTHQIIRDNLGRSPLYTGKILSTGVRYCPSIEDKVVKFADKERHQVFLEPQGLDAQEIYPNGISTSLPEDVQADLIHSIEGLEEAKIIRFGYGIEHDVVDPTQIYPTLETKLVDNLYNAGQINGTTGYEEAAAQGLVAGINAALRIQNREPLVLDRASSYIGVLIDDLTTKGTNEPYRMFTSRVEYRLILREDNADIRLGRIGHDLGLLGKKEFEIVREKIRETELGINFLKGRRLKPSDRFKRSVTLEELLKRPEVGLNDLEGVSGVKLEIPENVRPAVEIEVKYSGFIQRQLKDVERFKNLEKIKLPSGLDYSTVNGLSREIKEKLERCRPLNLGQASRISGVTPAAISILMVYLRKINGA